MEWSLILGIALAAVGGITGAWDALRDADRTDDELKEKQKDIQEEYELNKKILDDNFQKSKDEAENRAEGVRREADINDKGLNLSERSLSQTTNTGISDLQNQQKQDALDWNIYAINAGKEKGGALAQLGTNGTRAGSSLSDAVELDAALNSQQLQTQQDNKRAGYDNFLGNLLMNYTQGNFSIYQGRQNNIYQRGQADRLEGMYQEGGAEWNSYQLQLDKLKLESDNAWNQLDRARHNNAKDKWWNFASSLLTGGKAGWSTGTDIGNYLDNYATK